MTEALQIMSEGPGREFTPLAMQCLGKHVDGCWWGKRASRGSMVKCI